MNIIAIQAIGGTSKQSTENSKQVSQPNNAKFGSIFNSVATRGAAVITPTSQTSNSEISLELVQAIFNVTSVEELETVIETLVDCEEPINLEEVTTVNKLDELASYLGMEPKELIKSLLPLLKKVGLNDSEIEAIVTSKDVWTILDQIDKVAPAFFSQLTTSVEGKGEIPQQQAVKLLAMLKTIELVAPKTDLFMKQEQQVFSLQNFLTIAGEHFENVLKSNSTNKPSVLHLMGSHSSVKFVEVGQNSMLNEPNTSNQTEITSMNSTTKESSQQTVSSASSNIVVTQTEVTLTKVENSSNARNEELLRQMQNIFKRSNFGQTGGTNRLLIKLYPEHLGQLRIELLQTNGIMTARILASTALGKEMLDSQLHQLRNAFVQQNVQVDRIDISQTLQDSSRNERDQAFSQHFKREQQENETQHEHKEESEMTFQEYMIELEA